MSVYMILQMIRTKEAMLFGHHMAEAFVNMTKNAHRDAGRLRPPPSIFSPDSLPLRLPGITTNSLSWMEAT